MLEGFGLTRIGNVVFEMNCSHGCFSNAYGNLIDRGMFCFESLFSAMHLDSPRVSSLLAVFVGG